MKKLILVCLFLSVAVPCLAVDVNDKLVLQNEAVNKFKRGITSIVTSPLEFPREIVIHWNESRGIEKPVYLFGGAVKGVAYFVGRLGSGLWDVFTFNLGVPAGYEPLMKPDYIFEKTSETASTDPSSPSP